MPADSPVFVPHDLWLRIRSLPRPALSPAALIEEWDRITASRQKVTQKVTRKIPRAKKCEQLILVSKTGGDPMRLVCDRKRCGICGPQKRALLWKSITEAFGFAAYVGRVDRDDLDAMASRVRQQRRRYPNSPIEYSASPSGVPREFIVISNAAIHDAQRFMELGEWRDRIVDGYWMGVERVRRSALVSRVRLTVSRRRRDTGGEPARYQHPATLPALTAADTFADMVDDMVDRAANAVLEWEWRKGRGYA